MYGLLLLVSSFISMAAYGNTFEVKKCDHSNYEDYIWFLPRIKKLIFKTTKGCQLRGIDLSKKDLAGAHFCMADLRDANLRAADLTRASFVRTDIRGADLTGSVVNTTRIDKIKFDEHTKWEALSGQVFEPHEVPSQFELEDYQNGEAEHQRYLENFFRNACKRG